MAEWQLERLTPGARRGQRIDLDRATGCYVLGRSERSDIKLYTSTASRQHAELKLGASGQWVVVPLQDKRVLVDGEDLVGECELCEGLSLVLGGDRFRCQSPRPDPVDGDGRRTAASLGAGHVVLALVVLFAAVCALVVWQAQ